MSEPYGVGDYRGLVREWMRNRGVKGEERLVNGV